MECKIIFNLLHLTTRCYANFFSYVCSKVEMKTRKLFQIRKKNRLGIFVVRGISVNRAFQEPYSSKMILSVKFPPSTTVFRNPPNY